jgi:hypothetical protein
MRDDLIQIAVMIVLAVIGAVGYQRKYRTAKVDGAHWFLHFTFEVSFSMVVTLFACWHALERNDAGGWAYLLTFWAFVSAAFLGAARRICLGLSRTKMLRTPLDASILVAFTTAVVGVTFLALLIPNLRMR